MRVDEITLDWLHARTIARDGCLIWAACYGRGGTNPQATIDGKPRSMGRVIWELAHQRAVPAGLRVGPGCTVVGCVHPDHLVARRPSVIQRGQPISLVHRMHIAQGKRAQSNLPQDVVQQIRLSELPAPALAEAHGIDKTYVYMIKRDEVRRDYSTPFFNLGAQ